MGRAHHNAWDFWVSLYGKTAILLFYTEFTWIK